jgi:sugar lactone lactonase YvrE
VDTAGTVYVADTGSHSVRKIAAAGMVSVVAGRTGDGTNDGVGRVAGFDAPEAMTVEPAGSVIIADTGNHTIRRVALDGTVTTIAGTAGVAGSSDGPGTTRALFNKPGGVTSDFLGNLYVADTGNHTIRKITPDGAVSTLAGSPGVAGAVNGVSSVARFNNPRGIVMDAAGSLFVADTLNQVIRKISVAGAVSTFAGAAGNAGSADGATGSLARFNQPQGLAIDALGNLYVADTLNSCIRQITPALMENRACP